MLKPAVLWDYRREVCGREWPDPRPSADWFEHMMPVRPDTEREVEMHFASPLFCALGYAENQEAAGFGIRMAQGSRPQRIEADLVYFADERRSSDDGEALVLVECKTVVPARSAICARLVT